MRLIVIISFAVLALSKPLHAESRHDAARADWSDSQCREVYFQYCDDVEPGGGAIMKCVLRHLKDASPSCVMESAEWGQEVPNHVFAAPLPVPPSQPVIPENPSFYTGTVYDPYENIRRLMNERSPSP